MGSTVSVILGLVLAVLVLVLFTVKLKIHPFFALIATSATFAIVAGMNMQDMLSAFTSGMGGTIADIGLVIALGTVTSTLLEKSGAAETMAKTILKITGKKHAALGLAITGYFVSIPVFCDSAFVLLSPIGLSGKSVVPMLIGFGCTVPAVMAARTLPSERDRTMTILLTPFMSCSAKIPIYAFFSAAFFPKYAALVMIGLYVLGILFGILSALVLKSAFRGRPVPFVMELPNYRLPSVKSVALLLWDKAKDFIERAFTVIFLATIVIWFLQSFDTRLDVVTSSEQSLLAMVGRWLAPIFAPLGFADWRCATALITGFIAKESVVSTLQILLGTAAVSTLFTAKAALSFLVFTLLYTPCVAAIAAIRRETGSALRAALIALSQCCIAWLAAFAVYHLTLLL